MRKVILLFLLFISHLTFASFDMNDNIRRSYSHIINLEFDKAGVFLSQEEFKNPQNGFIPIYRNYIDFLTILTTEDLVYFEAHEGLKEDRIHLLNKNDKNSPYYLYAKSEILLQWAFTRLKFEQYFSGTYELVQAYRLLEENQRKFPQFTLNNKGLGLIHSLLGAVPNEFQWILNLAGLEGSMSTGLSELDLLLNDKSFAMYHDEVLFLLSFLQINLGNNDTLCKKYLNSIGDRYKDNLLLNFAAARLSHNLGLNDYCLRVLENRPHSVGGNKFYYLDYLQAMCYLYALDYENAKQKFEGFLIGFHGTNYIKSANHKLAWIAFLQDNTELKNTYFGRVISDGNSITDEDRAALMYAKSNSITHSGLLKTRLLYDGGYYLLALSEINRIKNKGSSLSEDHKIEYWYRMARIQSKLSNDNALIISCFQKALERGSNDKSYYAPMSALQIGLIYEKEEKFYKARSYFNKCLAMSGFDYERGIHLKANSALDRLEN
tara:strand:- start:4654 stop:6129 length:1476 start_codon:yes stop_codon:yes gene_type:complete